VLRVQGAGFRVFGSGVYPGRLPTTVSTKPAGVKWPWGARARGGYPAPGGSLPLRVDGFYRGTVYGFRISGSWFKIHGSM
jgi:hypothetical protein